MRIQPSMVTPAVGFRLGSSVTSTRLFPSNCSAAPGGAHDKLKIVPGSMAELQLALAKETLETSMHERLGSEVACSAPTIATLRRFRLASWLLLLQ